MKQEEILNLNFADWSFVRRSEKFKKVLDFLEWFESAAMKQVNIWTKYKSFQILENYEKFKFVGTYSFSFTDKKLLKHFLKKFKNINKTFRIFEQANYFKTCWNGNNCQNNNIVNKSTSNYYQMKGIESFPQTMNFLSL